MSKSPLTDEELLAISNRVMDTEGESSVCDSLPIFRALADYAYAKGAWDVVDLAWEFSMKGAKRHADMAGVTLGKYSQMILEEWLEAVVKSRGIERPQ